MSLVNLILFLLSSADQTRLQDGVGSSNSINQALGGELNFVFRVQTVVQNKDLTVTLTKFSDWSDPDLFIKQNEIPTTSDYTYKSAGWGYDSIIIPSQVLKDQTDYHILISCVTYCSFTLTVSYAQQIQLLSGHPISGNLTKGLQSVYVYEVGENTDQFSVGLSYTSGFGIMYVAAEEVANKQNTLPVQRNWFRGWNFFSGEGMQKGAKFYITVEAFTELQYSILAVTSSDEVITLQASVPISGVVDSQSFRYYKIRIDSPDGDLGIQMTPYSGDPDIYVRSGSVPTLEDWEFRSEMYGNQTLTISKEDREQVGALTGDWFIGIYGFTQCSFLLKVSLNREALVQITPGVTQTGHVNQNQIQYYGFLLEPNTDFNISVYMVPEIGNTDLYMKQCLLESIQSCKFSEDQITDPGNSDVYVSNHNSGTQSILVFHNAEKCTSTPCSYIIGVLGVSEGVSYYSISMTENQNTEHILRQGVAVQMSLPANSYKYFMYTVHNMTAYQLDFSLTSVTGDSDLYASRQTQPDVTNYQKKSSKGLNEVDKITYIRGQDSDSLEGNFFISVYSTGQSTFSLIALETRPTQTSTIHIFPGHPQKDTLFNATNQDYRIYYFLIHCSEETKQDIRISLTALTGKYDLYATNKLSNLDWQHQTFYYDWKSNNTSDDPMDTIIISKNDRRYKINSTYLILVMSRQYTANLTATYSLTYQVGDGATTLIQDVPVFDQVSRNKYNYYWFPIQYNRQDLTISVTALSGDPDLYISLSPDNTRPTVQNNDFHSISFGSEHLTLTWEDGIQDLCPPLPDSYTHGDPVHCKLYMGVLGYGGGTSYRIKIHPSRDIPQRLIPNYPQTGQMNQSEYTYYYSSIDTHIDFEVNVQPNSGDTDLFMYLYDSAAVGSQPGNWERPTRSHFDYYSQSSNMVDTISFTSGQLQEKCSSGSCIGIFSLYCFTNFCEYTINSEQDDNTVLLENQPRYGEVGLREYKYYHYYVNSDQYDLLISVTPLAGGDPDIYVSKGSEEVPTQQDSQWSSTTYGGDKLLIKSDDDFFEDRRMIGTYTIAVYGFSACSYTIVVNNHPTHLTRLNQGVPTIGSLLAGQSNYYYFMNYIPADILVTLTPTIGEAYIAIMTYDSQEESDVYDNPPSLQNYIWSSLNSPDRYIIVIPSSDPNFCTYCQFVIAIIAGDRTSSYTLTARNQINIQTLQNGIPVKGHIDSGEEQFYQFAVSQPLVVDIALTAYSGDPDLYVGNMRNLTVEGEWIWESIQADKVDHIRIQTSDQHYMFIYGIMIKGFTSSYYSLTAHTTDTYVKLVSGWPLTYSLKFDPSDAIYFQYGPFQQQSDVVDCSVKPLISDFYPTVYVDYTYQRDTRTPGPQNSDYQYLDYSYDEIYGNLNFQLERQDENGLYNIGVYGNYSENYPWNRTGYNYFPGQFEISCTNHLQTQIIQLNSTVYDSIPKGVLSKAYEINLNDKGHFQVIVTPCLGAVGLKISSNWTLADSQSEPDVVVDQINNGVLKGVVRNAQGKYFISISVNQETDLFNFAASFELKTVFAQRGTTIPTDLVPGGEGVLTFEEKSHSKVNLSWEPLVYENSQIYLYNNSVKYLIYQTSNKKVNLISACGIYVAERNQQAERAAELIGETSKTFKLKEHSEIINVLAIARDPSGKSSVNQIPYNPVIISVKNTSHQRDTVQLFWFWAIAGVLCLSIGIAAFLFWKLRKVKKKLDIEMSDVRNVAATVSSGQLESEYFSRKPVPYQPLRSPDNQRQIGYM